MTRCFWEMLYASGQHQTGSHQEWCQMQRFIDLNQHPYTIAVTDLSTGTVSEIVVAILSLFFRSLAFSVGTWTPVGFALPDCSHRRISLRRLTLESSFWTLQPRRASSLNELHIPCLSSLKLLSSPILFFMFHFCQSTTQIHDYIQLFRPRCSKLWINTTWRGPKCLPLQHGLNAHLGPL